MDEGGPALVIRRYVLTLWGWGDTDPLPHIFLLCQQCNSRGGSDKRHVQLKICAHKTCNNHLTRFAHFLVCSCFQTLYGKRQSRQGNQGDYQPHLLARQLRHTVICHFLNVPVCLKQLYSFSMWPEHSSGKHKRAKGLKQRPKQMKSHRVMFGQNSDLFIYIILVCCFCPEL